MHEPHDSPMKWPGTGGEEEAGEGGIQTTRVSQSRSQDADSAVHYAFQREPQDEIQSLASKQRWAVGDDNTVEINGKTKII
ncbi:unnamed protein product [Leptidea sinapis]|uniref:Uncharacterized protein n=1 Tax=Leptidea sinapis TaxID=189913 RepID=A0A5E4PZQ2_9NEOP|nr:unnamed protein product [Leptidea sinapis]